MVLLKECLNTPLCNCYTPKPHHFLSVEVFHIMRENMRPYLIASAVTAILSSISMAHANHTPNPDEPKLRS